MNIDSKLVRENTDSLLREANDIRGALLGNDLGNAPGSTEMPCPFTCPVSCPLTCPILSII